MGAKRKEYSRVQSSQVEWIEYHLETRKQGKQSVDQLMPIEIVFCWRSLPCESIRALP
uniref:Bm12779 n=1 Tax=Brugia malayi TaxID=6279 RepID=A0A1I9G5Z8_BRUMA|nr:Bm12779 [Brugia malayi]